MTENKERNEQIFKLANENHSYGLIAKILRITRSTVAGVIWRLDNPKRKRNNKGHHGAGSYAKKNLWTHG